MVSRAVAGLPRVAPPVGLLRVRLTVSLPSKDRSSEIGMDDGFVGGVVSGKRHRRRDGGVIGTGCGGAIARRKTHTDRTGALLPSG